ncbi:MAG: substrate-binding domain-containing protein [Planctomycetes bacterium]|nr:substrate-binding domain-containing protein [Planctomycetota bacterium]
MGNNQPPAARGLIVLCCSSLLAACLGDGDPIPQAAQPAAQEPGGPYVASVVQVAYLPAAAMPAPAVELRAAPTPAERRSAAIVVGRSAEHVVDQRFARTFTSSRDGVDGVPVVATDRDAVELMQLGRADFAVIGGNLSARDQQSGLRGTRLGVELFALSVAPQSAVRSLTHTQVRQIFTGQVTTWAQLGMAGGAIVPLVPSAKGLAERAARVLIPGDPFAPTCLGVASERHVVDQLLREPGAIGIVCLNGEPRVDGQKLVAIDWSPPTIEAFQYATYPYGMPVTLVTSGPPSGIAADFLAFARSEAGRGLLARALLTMP